MQTLTLKAPAKINYRLDVLGKRADGYHDLRMIMQQLDLCDQLTISLSEKPGIRINCNADDVPNDERNIAWKAANLLYQLTDQKTGIDISIKKIIPVAAGLGGGSSDCAAVLRGVNELLGLGFTTAQLMEKAVKLGADVPFFLFARTARAEGIGEQLSPLVKIPDAWVVLVNPNLPVSTAWVYKNLKLQANRILPELPDSYNNLDELVAILANDLETVTIPKHPLISEIKEQLVNMGAAAAMMSGSGPTVFALFDDEAKAKASAFKMTELHPQWFIAAVSTLTD
jgi:4-diphosphocytidyl-2-C-methyl-D-erythritol kinase